MRRTEEVIRVLLVDDDPAALKLLEHHLTSRGYCVFTATDGEAAQRRIREEAPQLIIADWMMAGVDGLSLVRHVRQSPELPFIYFILISGRSDRADIAQGLDAGADDFLVKPIDERELHARLKAAERIIRLEMFHHLHTQRLQKVNLEISLLNDRILRLSDEVRDARRRADEARRSRQALLSDMSQEIRLPVKSIMDTANFLHGLEDRCGASTQRAEAVEAILHHCQRLLDQVNDVLDLARLDAGTMTPQWEEASPRVVAYAARDHCLRDERLKNRRVIVEAGREVPERLWTDPHRLRQMLCRLVSSAAAGTVTGDVVLSLFYHDANVESAQSINDHLKSSGVLVIRVAADGTRWSAEDAREWCDRLHPAKPVDEAHEQEPSLEMRLGRQLARLLGGELRTESQAEGVARFLLRLPIHAKPSPRDCDASEKVNRTTTPVVRRGLILVAVENDVLRQRIVDCLNAQGVDLLSAASAREALHTLTHSRPSDRPIDAVVMHSRLPDMDETQFRSVLRQHGYEGPLIDVGRDPDDESPGVIAAEENATFPASYLGTQWRAMLRRYVRKGGDMNATMPIQTENLFSSFADDADMRELVEAYVHELPARAAAIRDAYRHEDLETLGRLVHQLKGSAGGYGFAPITEAAKALEESVKARRDLDSMRNEVDILTKLCQKARAARQEN